MKRKIIKLLYRSFDKNLSKKEQNQLNEALSKSPELQKKRAMLLKVRDMLSGIEKPAIEPLFSNRVMEKIYAMQPEREQVLFYDSLVYVFRRVAFAVTIALVLTLFYTYFNTGSFDPAEILIASDINFEELIDSDTNLALE